MPVEVLTAGKAKALMAIKGSVTKKNDDIMKE